MKNRKQKYTSQFHSFQLRNYDELRYMQEVTKGYCFLNKNGRRVISRYEKGRERRRGDRGERR
jgi:hypothetical protein